MSDKRQHPRIPVSLTVSYPSKGALARDLISDLSPGGVFIRTSQPLPIGTEIDCRCCIADEEPPIGVRGKVVWLRSGPAHPRRQARGGHGDPVHRSDGRGAGRAGRGGKKGLTHQRETRRLRASVSLPGADSCTP